MVVQEYISFYITKICPFFKLQAAFRYAYEQHLTVVVKCDYLAKFYKNNHEKFHNMRVIVDLN